MSEQQNFDNLNAIADNNIRLSEQYRVARFAAGKAKYALDAILASKYSKGSIDLKIAYGKAIILLCSESEECLEYYKTYILERAKYKALERVIEANKDKLSINQSIFKYTLNQGG